MNILLVTSESVPYIKTGGLGDVSGNLAENLSAHGHNVNLVLPLYRDIAPKSYNLKLAVPMLHVQMGDAVLTCQVWKAEKGKNLNIYFIEYNEYFDRSPIYDDGEKPYFDNGIRYAFFSKAALELSRAINFKPDVVQCNDWQTALTAYYLKTWRWGDDFFKDTASVLIIHNLGYQGQSDLSFSQFIGLNWMQMRPEEFESLGAINLLKGGIFYSDQIVTVSPTYAKEILSEPGGCGLSPYLQRRSEDLSGILNGLDTDEWNPENDPLIPKTFSAKDLSGKAVCKSDLQERFYLKQDPNIPVFGMVGRLASQKGLDLLQARIDEILQHDIQLVLLGSGDPELSHFFGELPKRYPGKVGTYIGFKPYLSHIIEAGSDFFIMPSRYEPCGLNQMYSLAYGTLPIVRGTGGLNDTVENYDQKKGTGTGFVFYDPEPDALKNTLLWAIDTWKNRRPHIDKLRQNAMAQSFTWEKSIKEYEKVFEKATQRKRGWF